MKQKKYSITETEARGILKIIKEITQTDFSGYKISTVCRRINKRLGILHIKSATIYKQYLRENLTETNLLVKELLINVTEFFRDPEVYQYIAQKLIPQLAQIGTEEEPARIWIAGCATGEEAYSWAILLDEYESINKIKIHIRLIATDIKKEVIRKAMKGEYTPNQMKGISEERYKQFFNAIDGKFKVKKRLRERILFSVHNIVVDPPFSRMDVVSCRNLLIYFNKEVQFRILANLNFSLNPQGYLILGKSETAILLNRNFKLIENRFKIYQKMHHAPLQHSFAHQVFLDDVKQNARISTNPLMKDNIGHNIFKDIVYQYYSPAMLIIDSNFYLQHITHKAQKYIKLPNDFTKMHSLLTLIPDAIKAVIRAGVAQIAKKTGKYRYENVNIQHDQQKFCLTISIELLKHHVQQQNFYAILFEEISPTNPLPSPKQKTNFTENIAQQINLSLQEELEKTEANLNRTIEELEKTNQNLTSSNEELQSANEEYQSVNEELQTINHDYQRSIQELSEINSDLDHLMQSTRIGTIFLDSKLRVRKFTKAAQKVVNLIDSDEGRPLHHITNNLQKVDLNKEVQIVLEKQKSIEKQVQTHQQDWYLLRILPYNNNKTQQNIGIVISLVNINQLKKAELSLQKSEEKFRQLYQNVPVGIVLCDEEGHFLNINPRFCQMLGYSLEELKTKTIEEISFPDDLHREYPHIKGVIEGKQDSYQIEKRYLHKSGQIIWGNLSVAAVRDSAGQITYAIAAIEDISLKKATEKALKESEEKFRIIFDNAPDGILLFDIDQQKIIQANHRLFPEIPYEELLLISPLTSLTPTYQADGKLSSQKVKELILDIKKNTYINFEWQFERYNGTRLDTEISAYLLPPSQQQLAVVIVRDITERKKMQQGIEEREQLYKGLFNNSLDAIVLFDLDNGRLEKANQQACIMLGYTEQELLQKKPIDLLPPTPTQDTDSQQFIYQTMQRLKKGERFRMEVKRQRSNGEVFETDTTLLPIFLPNKKYVLIIVQDISQKKRQARIIANSNKRFQSIFEMNALGISLASLDNKIIRANKTFANMLGYTTKELTGMSFLQLTYPDDQQTNKGTIRTISNKEKKWGSFEKRYIRKDKSVFWARLWVSILTEQDGQSYYLATIENIDRQKQMLKALTDSETKFKALFNNSYNYTALLDEEGKIIQQNESSKYKNADLDNFHQPKHGYWWASAWFSHDSTVRNQIKQDTKKALNGQIVRNKCSYRIKGEELGTLDYSLKPVFNKKNNLNYVIAESRDITELVQAQQKISKQKEKLGTILSNSYTSISIVDAKGYLIEQNLYGERHTITKPYPLWQIPMLASFPESQEQVERDIKRATAGKFVRGQCLYTSKKGQTKQLDYTFKPIFDKNKKLDYIIAEVRDITNLLKMQKELSERFEELNKKNKELQKYIDSNLELENFAYVTSHDLRQPLRTVISFTQLLSQKYQEKKYDEANNIITFIINAAKDMNDLINDLLKFSRVNTQPHTLRKLDIEVLLLQIMASLRSSIKKNKAQICYNIGNFPTKHIFANRSSLKQVFQNLISNAIKFQKPNTLPIVTINCTDLGNYWQFSVADNGIGIEQEYFDRIFLIFKRLHTKQEYEGTGIGLAICKKAIEQHQGKLWVTSKYGEGTTFYFTLPKNPQKQ